MSRLERLARDIEEAGERADAEAKSVQDLLDLLDAGAEIRLPSRGARPRQEEHVLRAEAAAGATSVALVRDSDGTRSVSIGGRRPFPVAPQLANLIAVLTGPGGATRDGVPGWRTTAEVALALNKRTGGSLTPRAVSRLVYKLRRAFRRAGENELLIQTNAIWGVRLAVQRGSMGMRGDRGEIRPAPAGPAAGIRDKPASRRRAM